jgi:hypothetical protein
MGGENLNVFELHAASGDGVVKKGIWVIIEKLDQNKISPELPAVRPMA